MPMAALPALGVTIFCTTLPATGWPRLPWTTVPACPGSRHSATLQAVKQSTALQRLIRWRHSTICGCSFSG